MAEAAKAERAAHISEERKERLRYYDRRELGRDPQHDSVSLIIDKCDSTKTTVPWFKQSPGAWWSALRKECLCQHLLGVLVHDRPDKIFLYTVNDTIKGDANLNIEGIRRLWSWGCLRFAPPSLRGAPSLRGFPQSVSPLPSPYLRRQEAPYR